MLAAYLLSLIILSIVTLTMGANFYSGSSDSSAFDYSSSLIDLVPLLSRFLNSSMLKIHSGSFPLILEIYLSASTNLVLKPSS